MDAEQARYEVTEIQVIRVPNPKRSQASSKKAGSSSTDRMESYEPP